MNLIEFSQLSMIQIVITNGGDFFFEVKMH